MFVLSQYLMSWMKNKDQFLNQLHCGCGAGLWLRNWGAASLMRIMRSRQGFVPGLHHVVQSLVKRVPNEVTVSCTSPMLCAVLILERQAFANTKASYAGWPYAAYHITSLFITVLGKITCDMGAHKVCWIVFFYCFIGIVFSTLVFGPACGFILGSLCTRFYVDAVFIDTSK